MLAMREDNEVLHVLVGMRARQCPLEGWGYGLGEDVAGGCGHLEKVRRRYDVLHICLCV